MIRHRMMQWMGLAPRNLPASGDNPALQAVARALVDGNAPEGWQLLSSSAQARVARGTWEGQAVYLKVFLPRSPFEEFKALGRGSRGARSVDRSIQMRRAGFHTPPVLTYGRCATRLEYMLTESVSYPALNALLIRNSGSSILPFAERSRLLRAFGGEVARLHRAGWIHGDLRLGNVLCNCSNDIQHPEFWYLDNEGSRRSYNARQQRRNLVQLVMTPREIQSRTDQLRLLQGYAHTMSLDRSRYRKLVYRVEASRNRRWQGRLRKGGPKRRFHSEDRGN